MGAFGAIGRRVLGGSAKALRVAAVLASVAAIGSAPALANTGGSEPRDPKQAGSAEHTREQSRPMVVFAWNYTPDPQVTSVKRAVAAHFHWGDGGTWAERGIRFYVDGQVATARQAAARLRELPVLTWCHPYHYKDIPGAPANFSPEAVKVTEELVALAKTELLRVLSEEVIDRINHVVDFEGFAHYDKPNLVPGATFAVGTDHASTACHLFGAALRACGWEQKDGSGAANYGTCHAARCPNLGVEPHFRQTPAHVPGSMDSKTTFLTGYTSGGPQGCLSEEELLDGIAKARGTVWLAIEDYQPKRGAVIRAAKASGKVRLLALWGTEYDEKRPAVRDRQRNRQWAREQDSAIAEALR